MSDLDFETAPAPPPALTGLPFWKPKQFFNTETETGQLLLIEVSHVNREAKYQSTEEADHVYGTVHALTGPKAGESFQLKTAAVKLVGQLRGMSGKRVLGRLGQMDVGQGSPAWILETDVAEEDKEVARKFLAGQQSDEPPF